MIDREHIRVLGVVTARGGSKGIPRKNARKLAGKPLLQYTAEAALGAKLLTDVVLSTDSEELAALGESYGLQVPFLRASELAEDNTPTLLVLQDAVCRMEQRDFAYDAICLLQPTSPIRRAEHIDACVELLQRRAADSVITVLRVPTKYNPHWIFLAGNDDWLRLGNGESSPIPRRQDLPPAFHRDGSVYVTRRDVLMDQDSLYGAKIAGYQLDPDQCVNVDNWDDWKQAEEMLRAVNAS